MKELGHAFLGLQFERTPSKSKSKRVGQLKASSTSSSLPPFFPSLPNLPRLVKTHTLHSTQHPTVGVEPNTVDLDSEERDDPDSQSNDGKRRSGLREGERRDGKREEKVGGRVCATRGVDGGF